MFTDFIEEKSCEIVAFNKMSSFVGDTASIWVLFRRELGCGWGNLKLFGNYGKIRAPLLKHIILKILICLVSVSMAFS